ncbi:MAG: hypothetical protein IKK62_00270 [Bacteroidaceae bacterium]|nr:hypothetical protein [Bacteroidaceae bacterium]
MKGETQESNLCKYFRQQKASSPTGKQTLQARGRCFWHLHATLPLTLNQKEFPPTPIEKHKPKHYQPVTLANMQKTGQS